MKVDFSNTNAFLVDHRSQPTGGVPKVVDIDSMGSMRDIYGLIIKPKEDQLTSIGTRSE